MRIVKLEAQDFKKLKAVTINPDGSIVRISGANGAGKSSTLDAISAALGGEKLCPKDPIRRGAEKAVVRVELDGDMVVERTFTASGSILKVMRKDGLKLSKPQAVLDELLGKKLVLDPLAFLRLEPKKQAEVIRELAGVDLSSFEAKRQQAYDQRTEVGRDLDRAKALKSASQCPMDPGLPAEEMSAADLLAEQQQRQAVYDQNLKVRHSLDVAIADYRQGEKDLAAAVEVARLAMEKVEQERKALDQIRADGKKLKEQVAALVDPDLAEVPEKLRVLEDTNRKVRARKVYNEMEARVDTLEANVLALTRAIEAADAAKAEVLAKAELPVEGLSFTPDGVLLGGLPFEQASQAEQLRVSMGVALKMNPKLPVALIRDASLLDKKSLALVGEMADAAGAQVWLEMVGADAGGVVIEDGEVLE